MPPETSNPVTTSLNALYDDLKTPRRRIALGNHLRIARSLGDAFDRRHAELLFTRTLVRANNKEREEVAQWFKNEKYDGLSPLQATELFAEKVHQASTRHRICYMRSEEEAAKGSIDPDLAKNSIDTINDVWHGRQVADMSGMDYEEFADKLVGRHVKRDRWRRAPAPKDLHSPTAYQVAEDYELRRERTRDTR